MFKWNFLYRPFDIFLRYLRCIFHSKMIYISYAKKFYSTMLPTLSFVILIWCCRLKSHLCSLFWVFYDGHHVEYIHYLSRFYLIDEYNVLLYDLIFCFALTFWVIFNQFAISIVYSPSLSIWKCLIDYWCCLIDPKNFLFHNSDVHHFCFLVHY